MEESQQKDLPLPQTDLPLPEKEIPTEIRGSTPNASSKWVKIGIIAVILVLLLGGVYILGKNNSIKQSNQPSTVTKTTTPTPTPNPTANWKTYTGNGFSFRYPTDWKVVKVPTTQNIAILTDSIEASIQKEQGDCKSFYPISIQDETGLISSDRFTNNDQQTVTDKNITVNGVNAILYSVISNSKGPCSWQTKEWEAISVVNNGKKYLLNLNPSDNSIYKGIFNVLISTFKFTNTSSQNSTPAPTTSDTSLTTEIITYALNTNWQTYADNPAAYELRFPPGYERGSSSEVGKNLYILNCTGGNCSTGYSVTIYNDYNGGSRRSWFNIKHPDSLINPYYENLVVQGVNGLLIMDGNTSGSTGSFVVVPRGSRMYEFSFPSGWNPQTGEKSGLPFIKEVLSTFKFL